MPEKYCCPLLYYILVLLFEFSFLPFSKILRQKIDRGLLTDFRYHFFSSLFFSVGKFNRLHSWCVSHWRAQQKLRIILGGRFRIISKPSDLKSGWRNYRCVAFLFSLFIAATAIFRKGGRTEHRNRKKKLFSNILSREIRQQFMGNIERKI